MSPCTTTSGAAKGSMEHRDERITCASCNEEFLFSAADAAAREERGLTTKPSMCKPCWRAKKQEQQAQNGQPPRRQTEPRFRDRIHDRFHDRRPPQRTRYTGDVNEYRSPMADPHFATYPSYGRPNHAAHAPRQENQQGPHRPARSFGGPSRDAIAPREGGAPRGSNMSGPRGPRGQGFAITCAACGVAASVPFKPAEGQKVYCRTCYRAEKPT